jgi:hypothetical protein
MTERRARRILRRVHGAARAASGWMVTRHVSLRQSLRRRGASDARVDRDSAHYLVRARETCRAMGTAAALPTKSSDTAPRRVPSELIARFASTVCVSNSA